ncbi:MAG: hypothetical protein WC055_00050 [Melioribacteraceae bacterium]
MKTLKIVIIILTVFTYSNSFAESNESFCRHVSIYAEKAMHARQQGVPLSSLIQAANGSKLFETIILNAYEYPQYSNRHNTGVVISEFRDMWYVLCTKQMND